MAASKSFLKTWVKPDVYPLIAAIGVGLTFMVYSGSRALFQPDVFVNKASRVDNGGEMCSEKEGKEYKHSPLREYVKTHYDVESTVSPHVPAQK
ncbi:hypothetical protein CLOM_g10566 [Closterium sp. NIES-68]|nr:hypothetical protein CLOM_g10566 [Closterium sp. NIES-68]